MTEWIINKNIIVDCEIIVWEYFHNGHVSYMFYDVGDSIEKDVLFIAPFANHNNSITYQQYVRELNLISYPGEDLFNKLMNKEGVELC
jgi:hypothetical protein